MSEIIVDGHDVAVFDDFKYLGSHEGSTKKHINTRIALACATFKRLTPILKDQRIRYET